MESLVAHWGYLALFLLTALSAFCIPVGSELAMAYAGAVAGGGVLLTAHHHFSLGAVIVVAVVGEIVGGSLGYCLGRFGGRVLVDRVGRFVLLTHRDLDRAEAFLARRGDPFVFVGRLIPLLRSFVSVAAGLSEMTFWRFLAFSIVADAAFASALCGLGYSLGGSWHAAVRGFSDAGYVAAVIAVLVVVAGAWHRLRVLRAETAVRGADGGRGERLPSGRIRPQEGDMHP